MLKYIHMGLYRSNKSYLCEESQGIVSTLGSHLSDQVLGAILQQLLFNGVPTLQPEKHKTKISTRVFQ